MAPAMLNREATPSAAAARATEGLLWATVALAIYAVILLCILGVLALLARERVRSLGEQLREMLDRRHRHDEDLEAFQEELRHASALIESGREKTQRSAAREAELQCALEVANGRAANLEEQLRFYRGENRPVDRKPVVVRPPVVRRRSSPALSRGGSERRPPPPPLEDHQPSSSTARMAPTTPRKEQRQPAATATTGAEESRRGSFDLQRPRTLQDELFGLGEESDDQASSDEENHDDDDDDDKASEHGSDGEVDTTRFSNIAVVDSEIQEARSLTMEHVRAAKA